MFCGAALAWPLSLVSFRFIAYRRPREAAFAAAFLCLSLFTLGVTAVLFAIIYRNFYAQWHGDPFTRLWLLQLVFTSAAAIYQFAVAGVRLYLPLGVAFLVRRLVDAGARQLSPEIARNRDYPLDKTDRPFDSPPKWTRPAATRNTFTDLAMIPRYSRPEMVDIWSPQSKFRIWFEIEAHACVALAELGVIPKDAAKTIWDKGGAATFDIDRIDEIERETKHDVIAFLTHLAEIVGPDARFVHQGMTSSDVLDTCFSVQLVQGHRSLAG